MRLQHITFTGVDAKTDLARLWFIQQQYPLAEFGVLVSKNWRDNGNRYFNPSFLSALDRGLNLSAHLCGSIARAAICGNFEPYREWASHNPWLFGRCQINIATSKDNPERFSYDEEAAGLFDEVIIQQKSAADCQLFMNSKSSGHVTVLLDASGGEGIDTPISPLLIPHKIGYAGGINPENVGEKLAYLMQNVTEGDFWIDMESGVRTNDWFDLDKVVRVLEVCEKTLKEGGWYE